MYATALCEVVYYDEHEAKEHLERLGALLGLFAKVQVLRLNAQPHAAKPSAHTTASTHLQSACATARRDPGAAGMV